MQTNPFYDRRHEFQVDRLTGSRFLGKSVFWRHLGKVQTKHVYRCESVEFRSLKLMVTETFLVVLVGLFFSITISMEYSGPFGQSVVSQNDFWKAGVDKINNLDQAWDWISDELVPRVFSSSESFTDSSSGLTPPPDWLSMNAIDSSRFVDSYGVYSLLDYPSWSPHFVGGSPFEGTILLGPVRVRQIASTLKTAPNNLSESIEDAFIYKPENITQQVEWISGKGTPFGGGGYTFDFRSSANETLTALSHLRTESWIDASTTALLIEVSVFNSRTGVVANTVITIEVLDNPSQSVAVEVNSFPIRIPLPGVPPSYVMAITTCAAFLAFTIFLIDLALLAGPLDFFTYAWNLLDVVLVILYFVYIGKWLSISTDIPSVLAPAISPLQSVFRPYSYYMDNQAELRALEAVLSVLIWLRLVKPLALVGPFRTTIKVIERMIWTMTWYILPITVAISFGIAWGLSIVDPTDFPSLTDGFYGMFFIFAHGMDLVPKVLEKPEISGPLLAGFALLMWVMLPGVCVAVALRCYRNYMQELKEAEEHNSADKMAVPPPGIDMNRWWHKDIVTAYIFTWVKRIKGVELYKEPEEDIGLADEQEIDLVLLPEIVQRRWSERRAELVEILENKPKPKRLTVGRSSQFGERMSRLMSAISKTQSKIFKRVPSVRAQNISIRGGLDPVSINSKITRIQLKRLLDSDKQLSALLKDQCGSKDGKVRAIDVIRKFNAPAAATKAIILSTLLGNTGFRPDGSSSMIRKGLEDVVNEFEASWKEQFTHVMESVTAIMEDIAELSELVEQRAYASRRSSASDMSFLRR